jgi:hypothetical protein
MDVSKDHFVKVTPFFSTSMYNFGVPLPPDGAETSFETFPLGTLRTSALLKSF